MAYFTEGQPTKGNEAFEHVWQGVRWRFATAEHLAAFVQRPADYAPRYGGFCAGGMAIGNKVPVDPEAFVIVDGKLYLNFNKAGAESFEASATESIQNADANWRQIGQTE